jgi:hypothetical protein
LREGGNAYCVIVERPGRGPRIPVAGRYRFARRSIPRQRGTVGRFVRHRTSTTIAIAIPVPPLAHSDANHHRCLVPQAHTTTAVTIETDLCACIPIYILLVGVDREVVPDAHFGRMAMVGGSCRGSILWIPDPVYRPRASASCVARRRRTHGDAINNDASRM